MEELQPTVATEEVAPQTETAEATDEAEVSGENQPTTVDENGNADAETSESNEDAEQNGTDGVDSAPFLSVRYNHEDR